MPELPEVETIRLDVHAELVGRTVKKVAVSGRRSVRRHPPGLLVERVEGCRLLGTGRRGKYLILELDSGDALVAHLGMSGQLLVADPTDAPVRHTHVELVFTGGRDLRFVDPRTFGEVFVSAPAAEGGDLPELAHLGLDALDEALDPGRLAALLRGRSTRLKPLLMAQHLLAGIGNLYADEILFVSGLRPDRVAAGLSGAEVGRLHASIGAVLRAAIDQRGSSLADEQYRDAYGSVGRYQLLHRVYAREGLPCPRCAAPVARVKSNGRSSFFCSRCQV